MTSNTQYADSGQRTADSVPRPPVPDPRPPSLLYVSTLDRIIAVMFPHLEAARAAGWRVEVACQPTVYRNELERYADAVHELPMRRFPLHPANLGALRKLVRLIRGGGYTIVHAHNPTGGIIGRLAATLAREKNSLPIRVYTAHGFHFHRHGGRVSNFIYRTAESIAGNHWSDGVLTITKEDYDAALAGRVVPKDRLFLTGGVGVSAQDEFNPANVTHEERRVIRCEIGAEDDAVPVVTMVGEFIPRKRHADAIAAFALVRRQFPDALLLLPGDGALLDARKAQADSLGIADGVRFLGYRRDIARLLAATDVFLFPSQQEGLPCSVQEALSMEVPVVGTDVRGNADLIDHSCGRLAPLGDISRLADAVSQLLALPPEARAAMGKAGREKMLRLYDRAACVAQWREIYTELLKRRGVTE